MYLIVIGYKLGGFFYKKIFITKTIKIQIMSLSSPGKIPRRPGTGLYDIPLPKSFSLNTTSGSPEAQRKTSSSYDRPFSRVTPKAKGKSQGLYDIPLPKSFSLNTTSGSPKAQRKTSSPKSQRKTSSPKSQRKTSSSNNRPLKLQPKAKGKRQGLYNIPLPRSFSLSSSPKGASVRNPNNVQLPRSSSLKNSSPMSQLPRTVSPKSKSPKRSSSPKMSSPKRSSPVTPMSPAFGPRIKRFFFVHFQFEGQNDFYVDETTYCDGVTPFPYDILYYPLKLPVNAERLKKLAGSIKILLQMQPDITQVLIYVDFRILKDLEQLRSQQEKFLNLLKYFEQTIGKLHLNFSVFVHFNKPVGECVFSRQKLYSENLFFKKFLIIYTSNTKVSQRYRSLFSLADSSQYDVREFPASKAADDVLKCQSWFEYFVDYVFGCLKGRLKQISGTCYLNAAVNGFVLTPTARKIALLTLQSANWRKDFDYKSPLNLGFCNPKTTKYFYRLMYNVVCSGFPLSDFSGDDDIMVEYSKIYSVNPKTGDGGFGWSALRGILELLNQDFTEIQFTGGKDIIVRRGTGDFLLYDFMSRDINVRGVKVYNGEDYLIQFAIITIIFADNKSHEVCGYICDGVYKVFDSNGFYFNINWRSHTELQKMKIGIEQNYEKKVIAILVKCVFIKISTIKALEEHSTESICSNL
jgi:hypothetical protein